MPVPVMLWGLLKEGIIDVRRFVPLFYTQTVSLTLRLS